MWHDTDRESFEHRVILLNPLLVSNCLFWKEFTLIIRYAECPNFEVANPIKPALTSRETTLMVSVLEVEVKLNLPVVNPIGNLFLYMQADFLEQLITNPMKLSTLLVVTRCEQDANNWEQVVWPNSDISLMDRLGSTCLQAV